MRSRRTLLTRDLHAAALADDALESDPLVLAAVALPVPRGTEDALAEQAVLLRLQRPVVDRLRLLDLTVGPCADLVRGGQADPELIEVVHVQHVAVASSACRALHNVQHFLVPAQSKSAPAGSRRDRSMPSSSAARKTSSSVSRSSISSPVGRADLDVQAERLHLLDQDLEGLGDARLGDVLALDDGLVDLHAAEHVVGLDRQQLLQRVGGAVGLEGPDLHLAEPLAAELSLPAQRLLRDHRVRAGGTGVDLVVHQVEQLQDVGDTDRDGLLVRLAGATVEQHAPCRRRRPACRRRGWGGPTRIASRISPSRAPSNTGVATCTGPSWSIAVLLEAPQGGQPEVRLEHLPEVHPGRARPAGSG